jgi:HK97 family phage portal protein
VIIRTARGADRELRGGVIGDSRIPSWSEVSSSWSHAGQRVTRDVAMGLPAVSACVQFVAETLGALSIEVWRGQKARKRLAETSWQHILLHEQPCGSECSDFDFIADINGSLETAGNAFVKKLKSKGRVVAMQVLNPDGVMVKRENGEKRFRVVEKEGTRTYTVSDILHIRGFTIGGSDVGFSPITLHRHALGAALALDEFQGRFFSNGAVPGGAIEISGQITRAQAEEMMEIWDDRHRGPENSNRPGILYNGATWRSVGMSLEDSQFVESQNLTVLQAARIYRIPAVFLDAQGAGAAGAAGTTEQDLLRLYFSLLPRIRRIERGLFVDQDLFDAGKIGGLYPLLNTTELLRSDAKTRAEVEHLRIQDGSVLVDEARAERGEGPLPPLPEDWTQEPGKVPQITPVGGAPNPTFEPAEE